MEFRSTLNDYLRKRMQAIAPNLTVMVGELVGARLIAHAGSLMNLAKQPASTVQILGAEKALFRALKTKHDTPKYGLIFHASLVGQSAPKNKGKISRVLAAKTALAVRVDALGDTTEPTVGLAGREKVEARLMELEGGRSLKLAGGAVARARTEAYAAGSSGAPGYNAAADMMMSDAPTAGKKRPRSDSASEAAPASSGAGSDSKASDDDEDAERPSKKSKKDKKEKKEKKSKKSKKE